MPPKNQISTKETCKICKSKVIDSVSCNICNATYHPSCAELKANIIPGVSCRKCADPASRPTSPTVSSERFDQLSLHISKEIQTLSKQMSQSIAAVDAAFNNLKGDFNILDKRVGITEQKIDSALSQILSLSTTVQDFDPTSTLNTSSEYILNEFELRNKAKSNVIVFGLPEALTNDKSSFDLATDVTLSTNLLNFFLSKTQKTNINNFGFLRIGKFLTARPNPRPLKILCRSPEQAMMVLTAAKNLRNILNSSPTYNKATFTMERTRRQQEIYQQLKQQLQTRLQQGETNLIIRHINGTPKIVTTPNPSTSNT